MRTSIGIVGVVGLLVLVVLVATYSSAFALVKYPILELGNCRNVSECRAYCENPTNHQACMDFAREKGLQEEAQGYSQKQHELLDKASSSLGCSSFETCHAYCEQNHERCQEFAKSHGMQPPQEGGVDPAKKTQLLEKARGELGCSSIESCRTFCEQNMQACMEFSKRHGFAGAGQQQPPEGYGSSYSPSGTSLSPEGCKTEEECRAYCQANPDKCPGFGSQPQPTYQPYPTYYQQPQSYPTPPPEGRPTQYQQPQQYEQTQPSPTP